MGSLPLTASHGLCYQAGSPWPLGATADASGVNFALFSANAQRVELCLINGDEQTTVPIKHCTNQIWHMHVDNVKVGQHYAYRVYGENRAGLRFSPETLLLDPYAKGISGYFTYNRDPLGGHGLRSVVMPITPCVETPPAPRTPWQDSILYEVHVKGATQTHPLVPPSHRGTYAGLASPAMLAHFKKLGVTTLCLMPVNYAIDEARLLSMGLSNYWGYNPLNYFTPTPRYATHSVDAPPELNPHIVVAEFRKMVDALHEAGLEVVLDVVFNHTAEQDESGLTLCYRGIDNPSYYRLPPGNLDRYENFTGCGNTFNLQHPRVLQLVMDALRYWVCELKVDGFRFDLAATLTRDSAFLATILQDPILSRVKLIAEPWDIGPNGYALGQFGAGWSEWNDRYRDDVRAFWLTQQVSAGALAQRIAGSSEIFRHTGRAPQASINFLTAHDGFTLHDLVSYEKKHNEANGEHNRDGHNHNHSINCGEEGVTSNLIVTERRKRFKRALLTTLLVSQGTPMLQAGDEIGKSQRGNNNAYCQDNAINWLNWQNADTSLAEFTAHLIQIRSRFHQLKQQDWLTGERIPFQGQLVRDVCWWHIQGHEIQMHEWQTIGGAFGMLLPPSNGNISGGNRTLLVLFNNDTWTATAKLPIGHWTQICDSSTENAFRPIALSQTVELPATSVLILYRD